MPNNGLLDAKVNTGNGPFQGGSESPSLKAWYEPWLDRNLLPDWLIRPGIRRLLAGRLRDEDLGDAERQRERLIRFIAELKGSPIALATDDANRQHYEVPAEFFRHVLGRRRKYSCGYWPEAIQTLDEAEETMQDLSTRRARIREGESVLDMGCGWGSFSLYFAERLPRCRIVGVSNSRSQKAFIDAEAIRRGLGNLRIFTSDMNSFDTDERFDRIVSIEIFEHVRNYERLLARAAAWLNPKGTLFIHIFAHSRYARPQEVKGPGDWMSQ